MQFDLQSLSPAEIYQWMTQSIIPRPIAWVLSRTSEAGEHLNLAPFSYFNALASDPPMVMISVGRRPDGRDKDTRNNLAVGAAAVIHIPALSQAEQVNQSAATLEPEVSEVETLGLALTDFPGSPLPRLADAPVAMAATVTDVLHVGRQQQAIILLELSQFYVADSVMTRDAKDRPRIDSQALNPLARLGAGEFAALGERLQLKRPG